VAQDFTLDDFRRQLDQVQKMGMKHLLGQLPGTSDMVSDEEDPDVALNRVRQILDAMTDEERSDPDIIDSTRRSRIAASTGTDPNDVQQFLDQFMSFWQRIKMITGFGKLPGQDGGA
jgi:signal recognition particle subunit SRP54